MHHLTEDGWSNMRCSTGYSRGSGSSEDDPWAESSDPVLSSPQIPVYTQRELPGSCEEEEEEEEEDDED